MKTKAILSVLLLLTAYCILLTANSEGSVPSLINYQGVLKDSTGVPYHGPATMIFSIWDDSTNGNKLWEETHPVVEVSHGLFNVLLGGVDNPIPDSVFDQPNAWLDVLVNGSQLSPRRQMVSVGYAFTDGDWTIDGDNIYREQGNVGIGTTSPQGTLDIKAHTGGWSGGLTLTSQDGLSRWRLQTQKTIYGGAFRLSDDDAGPDLILMPNGDLLPQGSVGIGTSSPQYKLDVEGYVQAHGYYTGDIVFQKDKEKLWRMFEDEDGLYLENLKTGKVYRFVLQEVEKE